MTVPGNWLVAPLEVSVLRVDNGTFSSADSALCFDPVIEADQIVSAQNRNPLFSNRVIAWDGRSRTRRLPTGMHVNWNVPQRLRHGIAGREDLPKHAFQDVGGLFMPKVPDRWLVSRYVWPAQGSPLRSDWLVYANAILPAAEMDDAQRDHKKWKPWTTVLKLDANYGFAGFGVTRPWQSRNDLDGVLLPGQGLTAMGHGGPYFSSSYFASRGSLGFYDPLNDDQTAKLTTGALSYTVVGWYSDTKGDPLATQKDQGSAADQVNAICELLDWNAPQIAEDVDGLLLQGAALDVSWNGKNANHGSGMPPQDFSTLRLSLQSDPLSASAELLGVGINQPLSVLRDRLAGFLSDSLVSADDLPKLKPAAHASGFTRHHAPRAYIIRGNTKTEAVTNFPAHRSDSPVTQEDDSVELPTAIVRALDAVNRICRLETQAENAHADMLVRQYDVWCRHARSTKAEEKADFTTLLDDIDVSLKELVSRAGSLAKDRRDALNNLTTLIKTSGLDLSVEEGAALPFNEPQDPALAIAWDPLHLADPVVDIAEPLTLRSSNALPGGLVEAPFLSVDALAPLDGAAGVELVADALSREIALYDPSAANALAGTSPVTPSSSDKPGARAFGGLVKDWTPMLARWTVTIESLDALPEGQATWTTGEDGIEAIAPASDAVKRKAHSVDGWSAIEQSTAMIVSRKVAKSDLPESGKSEITSRVRGLAEIRLVGSHQARMLQVPSQRVQLPDPDALSSAGSIPKPDSLNVSQDSAPAVGPLFSNRHKLIPKPMGGLKLGVKALWLIDAFGRGMKVINEDPPKHYVDAPPRLSAPARLSGYWLDEDALHGQVAQVHGWFLCNHIDKSLAVFDASGTQLGSMLCNLDSNLPGQRTAGFLWAPVPGDPASADYWLNLQSTSVQGPPTGAIAAGVLNDWVQALLSLPHDDVMFFINTLLIPKMEVGSTYMGEAGSNAFVSEPLALVSAAAGLEFAGLTPPIDKAIPEAFRGSNPIDAAPPVGNAGLQLGDFKSTTDGLLLARWQGLKPAFAAPAGISPVQSPNNNIAAVPRPVPIGGGEIGKLPDLSHIEMLISPTRAVRIRCGIVPEFRLQSPTGLERQMRCLNTLSFAAGPVLSDGLRPRIPIPSDTFGSWSWHTRPDIQSWSQPVAVDEIQRAVKLFDQPTRLADGWLSLTMTPIRGFHSLQGNEVQAGTEIHLVWDVVGVANVSINASTVSGHDQEIMQGKLVDVAQKLGMVVNETTTFTLQASDAKGAVLEQRQLLISVPGG